MIRMDGSFAVTVGMVEMSKGTKTTSRSLREVRQLAANYWVWDEHRWKFMNEVKYRHLIYLGLGNDWMTAQLFPSMNRRNFHD